MTPDITVLGAGGRIGRALVTALLGRARVRSVGRSTLKSFLASDTPAGHVISCIGLTADFRSRPLDTAEAHVGLTARILRRGGFEVAPLPLLDPRLCRRAHDAGNRATDGASLGSGTSVQPDQADRRGALPGRSTSHGPGGPVVERDRGNG